MAVNCLQRAELAEKTPQRRITLTGPGVDALDGFGHRTRAHRDPRLHAALEEVFAQPNAVTRRAHPAGRVLARRSAIPRPDPTAVADPTSALPWQPMVLHRGGWPDGC